MATTNNLVMPYYVKKVTNPTSKVFNRYFAHVRRQLQVVSKPLKYCNYRVRSVSIYGIIAIFANKNSNYDTTRTKK